MKYLIIDDEKELYKRMFADLFKPNGYSIEELPRMKIPAILKPLYRIQHNDKINRRVWIPGKMIWKPFYQLHKYDFNDDEQYCIIFLNGTLRYHFSSKYLKSLKKKHNNIKLVMILYDSYSNPSAQRSISMVPIFDCVFSFDEKDCQKYGLERIYSTFSYPSFVKKDDSIHTDAFFIGYAQGRLRVLQEVFKRISDKVENARFYIAGVPNQKKKTIKSVEYNKKMTYSEELQMAYNTDCIVEVLRRGQSGVTLRTCEAVAFNKKLLTNNASIKEMPFYDSRFISVFDNPEDIDVSFIKRHINVNYANSDFFSPLRIIKRLEKKYSKA